jgi:hypothetical protein
MKSAIAADSKEGTAELDALKAEMDSLVEQSVESFPT